jgi:hypothetical protein
MAVADLKVMAAVEPKDTGRHWSKGAAMMMASTIVGRGSNGNTAT